MPPTVDVLRVFTREGEGGNPLGVVTEVGGLASARMQAIAREVGFSETVFFDPAEAVPFVRIFTPATELAFAGHPLVGAAWWLGRRGRPDATLRCDEGEVGSTTGPEKAWIRAPSEPVVTASALDPGLWARPVEAWEVRMPLPYHLLRLASPDEVAALQVPAPPITEVLAWAWREEERIVKARFFAAGVGVPEDPATGSAAVALAAALRHGGRLRGDLTVLQGDEIAAPSLIRVRWGPSSIAIGGAVVADGARALG